MEAAEPEDGGKSTEEDEATEEDDGEEADSSGASHEGDKRDGKMRRSMAPSCWHMSHHRKAVLTPFTATAEKYGQVQLECKRNNTGKTKTTLRKAKKW